MSCLLRLISVIAFVIAVVCIPLANEQKKEYEKKSSLLNSSKTDLLIKQDRWKAFELEKENEKENTERKITAANTKTLVTQRSLADEIRSLASYGLGENEINNLVGKDSKNIRESITNFFHRHLPSDHRLLNGAVIRDEISTSESKASLTLENGLTEDAYVKLVRDDRKVISFYVRSNSKHVFTGIPDGNYRVMYCLGFGWDIQKQDFTRGRSAEIYDDNFNYATKVIDLIDVQRTSYDRISLTLHKVPLGNASTTALNQDEFDNY